MFESIEFWEIALTAFLFVLSWLSTKANKLSWVKESENQLIIAIMASAQRVKDKFLLDLEAAKHPDSDGGIKITKEELSAARQNAYEIVIDSLKGPALKYAKEKGEAFVKGLLGKVFDKMGIKIG